ncbi:GNAT family N-acetyltransferase [Frateuria sp. MAH-13]|uniref:GNAT family N-acetyltransferase n=1 Tax=Frateuria flava TaxID=2821489 RepID=A0ABS4DPC2_9GAMM|nr:GNAT family N-acetyltransferase [Frateuria flava]MBP1474912.1 GNAT family N-acetyltransferase [Frateuria flava]
MTHAPAHAPTIPVRRAAPADLDALVALERCAFSGDRMSRAQYRRHLASPRAAVLVADTPDEGLLGSALVFFRAGSTLARLYSIATAPAARGRGLGGTLLAAAEDAARARGCRGMRLEVRMDNTAAMALYERAGYRRIGRYAGYYEDGADAWRYEKGLAAC